MSPCPVTNHDRADPQAQPATRAHHLLRTWHDHRRGYLLLVAQVAAHAGLYAPLSFLIAALLALFTGFSYAEISARYPKSAGEAVYVQEGLRRRELSLLV